MVSAEVEYEANARSLVSERDSVAQPPPEKVLLSVRLELAGTISHDRDSQSCRTRSVNSSVFYREFSVVKLPRWVREKAHRNSYKMGSRLSQVGDLAA